MWPDMMWVLASTPVLSCPVSPAFVAKKQRDQTEVKI